MACIDLHDAVTKHKRIGIVTLANQLTLLGRLAMQSRFIGVTVIMGVCCHGVAFGQVIPDATLGIEASTVTQQANRQQIAGGAQRDNSLFHSFRDFNVGTAEAIYFANPAGVNTIISRVTGKNPSNILGVLGVEGAADLFLINPQGIMFGSESQLDIAGSFIATTADSVQLNGYEFSAIATPPLPVLTVQVSPGIQYGSSQPEAVISNQGRLVVGEQQQLILRGGTVQNTGELFAPGGLVELSGDVIDSGGTIITTNTTGDSGDITLSALGDLTVGLLDSRSTLGNGGSITVNSQTGSIATTNNFLSDGNLQAGDITIIATEDIAINGKLLTDSSLTSPNVADVSGAAGDITIIAGGNLDLQASASMLPDVDIGAAGLRSGAITLTSGGQLTANGIRILTRLAGDEIGEDIRISAQSMILNETSIGTRTRDDSLAFLGIEQDAIAGDVIVNVAEDITLTNSLIFTNADFTTANAGDVNLTAQRLQIIRIPGFDFEFFPASYGLASLANLSSVGNGGNLNVNVSDSIDLIGPVSGPFQADFDATSLEFLQLVGESASMVAGSVGFGDAGNINLQTDRLTIQNSAGLLTTGTFGNGGDATIVVDEINLQGASGILSIVDILGKDAGNIDIQARQATLTDGALILTTSRSPGRAGELSLTAEQLNIESGSGLASNARNTGSGGKLTVDVSDQLLISGTNPVGGTPSSISANSLGSGDAGDISIMAGALGVLDGATVTVSGEGQSNAGNIDIGTRSLLLDQSAITATSASGEGGNIALTIDDTLVLRQGSTISTTAGQAGTGGNGGNITFGQGFIVAVPNENSDITANAFQGNGGNIIITTQGLLGTEFRQQLTPQSDITASSRFGIDGEFIFEQTTPEPDSETVELPNNFIDAENQIVAGCPADSGATFIVTGRGGLPLDPRQDIEDTLVISVLDSSLDPAVSANNGAQQRATQAISQLPQSSERQNNFTLTEAQGWQVNEIGQIELIAAIDQATIGLLSQCIARGNHDT